MRRPPPSSPPRASKRPVRRRGHLPADVRVGRRAGGDRDEAARLTVRARGLVGEDACRALVQLIRESDAELAREQGAGAPAEGEEGADA